MIGSIITVLTIGGYAAAYPSNFSEAIDFFRTYRSEFVNNTPGLTEQERRMAAAIVAPEVSTYSTVINFIELRSMFVSYVYQGGGNFSVGVFQMKPSFAEDIEKKVMEDRELTKEYASWIADFCPGESIKADRRARLNRLDDPIWQMRYLTLFFRLAQKKTTKIKFKNNDEKLHYLATLYNSGIDITKEKAYKMMTQKRFPHFNPQFNYSAISLEFYKYMTGS
ncbi:MAG: hypothetical protein K2N05_03900 [Muribaculaceae bacterium]|nr:hypothetical protein [Muribaculaceae bacterium]